MQCEASALPPVPLLAANTAAKPATAFGSKACSPTFRGMESLALPLLCATITAAWRTGRWLCREFPAACETGFIRRPGSQLVAAIRGLKATVELRRAALVAVLIPALATREPVRSLLM